MKEVWKNIPGYVGLYAISTTGKVKRISSGPGVQKGKILKEDLSQNGYHFIRLHKDRRLRWNNGDKDG